MFTLLKLSVECEFHMVVGSEMGVGIWDKKVGTGGGLEMAVVLPRPGVRCADTMEERTCTVFSKIWILLSSCAIFCYKIQFFRS